MKLLLGDDLRSDAIRLAFAQKDIGAALLEPGQEAAMHYAHKLTATPGAMVAKDVQLLREAGFDDGQILEINQVVSHFDYANRTVLGLGCSTQGDIIGLSPGNSEDAQDWGHH